MALKVDQRTQHNVFLCGKDILASSLTGFGKNFVKTKAHKGKARFKDWANSQKQLFLECDGQESCPTTFRVYRPLDKCLTGDVRCIKNEWMTNKTNLQMSHAVYCICSKVHATFYFRHLILTRYPQKPDRLSLCMSIHSLNIKQPVAQKHLETAQPLPWWTVIL